MKLHHVQFLLLITISYTTYLRGVDRETGMVLDATPITGNLDTIKLNDIYVKQVKFLWQFSTL